MGNEPGEVPETMMTALSGMGVERHSPSEPPFVLIVEDDRNIRETLFDLLDESGYRVDSVGNAKEALERAERGPRPDVIVLDLMMPTMDGWQFRVEQRKRPRIADVPVVVISADVSAKAVAIDADAFVKKPFDFDTLRGVVERLLLSTERRTLELRTRELEHLRSLGTLVAGVAHEINNPLTFVSANLEIASREWEKLRTGVDGKTPSVERLQRAMSGARVGADRIENVVRALSRFSRADDERFLPLDVRDALESAVTLGSGHFENRAKIERDFGPVPPVMGSESRLGQVFLNLVVNAGQAIVDAGIEDGCIDLRTFFESGAVVVEVRDNGPGIPDDVLPKMFEPFFTTKIAGHGTGLGLSLSKDIVVAHGGTLAAHANYPRGAVLRVELPALQSTIPSRPRSSRPSIPIPAPTSRARILLVDDEPLVGTVFQDAFSDHEVVFYTDAHTALAHLAVDSSFDVVVSDSRMPGMTGASFFDEATRSHPELRSRFVFVTGTIEPEELARLERRSERNVVQKPFSVDAIRACLADIAAAQRPS